MKKGLIGCLGIFVVLTLIIGVGFYQLIYKPFIGDYVGSITQLAEVAELNERVDNRAAYTPPEDDVISERQLERFMAVQGEIEAELGQRVEALKAKYEELEAEIEREGRDVNYVEALRGFSDAMGLVLQAKRIQVGALNRQDFSLDEYAWVRREAYRAAGIPVLSTGLVEAIASEDGSAEALMQHTIDGDSLAAPAPNRRLIGPHQEQLERMAGLAFFGL